MIRLLTFIILVFISISTYAESIKCGDVQLSVINSEVSSYPYFSIILVGRSVSKIYKYHVENEFLFIRCDKKSDGAEVFLLSQFCGGSGCHDVCNESKSNCREADFGIIDAHTGEKLLEPEQTEENAVKAEKIMGNKIVPFTCSINYPASEGRSKNNEICFRAKVELG